MNQFEELKWEMFIAQMNLFKTMYNSLAKFTRINVIALIPLKRFVLDRIKFIDEKGGIKERKYFYDLLSSLNEDFNVDNAIDELENNLLCLKFNSKSKFYAKFGSQEICGRFLGLIENGDKETESNLTFKLGYPTENEILVLSYRDLEEIDSFI